MGLLWISDKNLKICNGWLSNVKTLLNYIPNLFRRLSFPFQDFKFKCWGHLSSFPSINIQVYTDKSVHGWKIQLACGRKELRQSRLNSNTGSAIRNWYKVKTWLDQHLFCQRPFRPHEVKKVSNGWSGINFNY